MRKFFLGIIILIALITAFIAFMFYHEPSSDELVGRSVVLEFGPKNEIHISKLGSQFMVSDTSFSNSKLCPGQWTDRFSNILRSHSQRLLKAD